MALPNAAAAVALARELEVTLATAESLTGGRVCATLAEVPGASAVLLGGVVSYALEVKREVLGVPKEVLDEVGPVSQEVAREMASGVRRVLGSRLGVSTTGAAGPEPHGGKEPGTVWLAVDFDGDITTRMLTVDGDRETVTRTAVAAAIDLAYEILKAHHQRA